MLSMTGFQERAGHDDFAVPFRRHYSETSDAIRTPARTPYLSGEMELSACG
jgi:hypothetical protein